MATLLALEEVWGRGGGSSHPQYLLAPIFVMTAHCVTALHPVSSANVSLTRYQSRPQPGLNIPILIFSSCYDITNARFLEHVPHAHPRTRSPRATLESKRRKVDFHLQTTIFLKKNIPRHSVQYILPEWQATRSQTDLHHPMQRLSAPHPDQQPPIRVHNLRISPK